MKNIYDNDLTKINGLLEKEGLNFSLIMRNDSQGYINPEGFFHCDTKLDEACEVIEKYYAGQGENVVFKEKGYVFEVC